MHPDWLLVLRHTLVPEVRFERQWFMTLTAVLGTTITPYLFFWQSALMVEDERAMGRTTVAARRGATDAEIRAAHADINTGMIFSNAIMFFIILTTAVTLGAHGKTNIATAQQAAEALRPLAGDFAYLLFTAGMVARVCAVPTLAGCRPRCGNPAISRKPDDAARAPRFYAVIAGVASASR